nr:NEL domain-containing protein [Bradyrhizobium guangdongense]
MREQYFEMASGANASCEDRITLVWNGMRTARLNADIEDGVYDGRLGELLQNGRVMFRSEALEGIARERAIHFVVPIPTQMSMRSRSTLPTRPGCATRWSCGTPLPTCAS